MNPFTQNKIVHITLNNVNEALKSNVRYCIGYELTTDKDKSKPENGMLVFYPCMGKLVIHTFISAN